MIPSGDAWPGSVGRDKHLGGHLSRLITNPMDIVLHGLTVGEWSDLETVCGNSTETKYGGFVIRMRVGLPCPQDWGVCLARQASAGATREPKPASPSERAELSPCAARAAAGGCRPCPARGAPTQPGCRGLGGPRVARSLCGTLQLQPPRTWAGFPNNPARLLNNHPSCETDK